MHAYRLFFFLAALLALAVGSQQLVDRVQAQSDTVAETADDDPEGDAVLQKKPAPTLGEIIFGSDWVGLIFYAALAALSLVATTAILERLVNLRRERVIPEVFARRLRELIARREDSTENLLKLCDNHRSPAAAILRSGLLRAGRPLPEVEKAMEDAAARELGALRGRNKLISVAGNIAPLLGLLGTVIGMIIAFRVASQIGTGKAEHLAEGIYVALLTTAGGLIIAIPCFVFAAWFNARAERFLRDIDELLTDVLPTFVRLEAESRATPLRVAPASAAS